MKSLAVAATAFGLALTAVCPTGPASAAPQRFALDSEASSLSYIVRTKVFLLLDEDVVGRSHPSEGELVVEEARAAGWLVLPAASFRSGVSSRDKHIAEILDAKRFPTIRFDLDSLGGFDPGMASGQTTVTGRLRVRDRTVPIKFLATYRQADGRLDMEGDVAITFSVFGIDPPILGFIAKRSPDALVLRARLRGRAVESRVSR